MRSAAVPPSSDPDPAFDAHGPEAAGRRMFDGDRMLADLGAALVGVGEGFAAIRMTLCAQSMQGHGTAHGGALFTRADATSGVASSTGPAPVAAQHCTISDLAPSLVGDALSIAVRRDEQAGRTGISDGTIVTGDGKDIAAFRGISRTAPER